MTVDTTSLVAQFQRDGFAVATPHISPDECEPLLARLRDESAPAPLEWHKGRAASDRAFLDLARDPRILEILRALLGEDVVLWGASLQNRAPGRGHAWHCDAEACAPEGGFVSVWIGLKNTGANSCLKVVPGSQNYGRAVQQECAERGVEREDIDDDTLLGWARDNDATADVRRVEMRNGELLIMDGRLWHGSVNERETGTRTALLLQYAAASRPVRRPAHEQPDWPFVFAKAPPPVIAVSGAGDPTVNRLIAPPPPRSSNGRLRRVISEIPVPLASDAAEEWRPHGLFRCRGGSVPRLVSHVSVLSPGHTPHPPHGHDDEEMLIVLDGEVEIVLAESEDDPAPRHIPMRPGMVSFYPSGQHHTLKNPSQADATYLLVKWRGPIARRGGEARIATGVFSHDGVERELARGATRWLDNFTAAARLLAPGAREPARRRQNDRIVMLVEGCLDVDGEPVQAPAIMAFGAGERHGLTNPGDTPAALFDFGFLAPLPADAGFGKRLRRALLPS